MIQILCHLWGDYILQSDWMAQNKTKRSWPALVHALTYSLCFVPLIWFHGRIPLAAWLCWGWIFFTHYLIDRYRMARYVVWAKNWMAPLSNVYYDGAHDLFWRPWYRWQDSQPTGYFTQNGNPSATPMWMATWLLIIADNTLHLTINYLALRYL